MSPPQSLPTRPVAAGLLALTAFGACSTGPDRRAPSAMDMHSHARPRAVQVEHLELDLTADFARRQLAGHVVLHFARHDPTAPLILDAAAGLAIESVTGADGDPRRFEFGAVDPILGRPVRIDLDGNDRTVRIAYRTAPDAAALQWLAPSQTTSGMPFLYTQGQAILTRSWVPLQDTPGVRVTYDATIRAPAELRVVMAAATRGAPRDGVHRFAMRQPIPPYLIAMACGKLEFREVSSRCGVWAEPAVVETAAAELEDTDDMLRTCESLFGPYRWERYDVLILPPAFPFGGMENPRLTFATPTILAGDKSLVGLIAHELAHSWSGNLVSNATWSDFWLNEGFTVFLEHRIMEAVYSRERAEMEILLGMQQLAEELAELPPADQVLHIDLAGRNPDDGMTAVPYDKGAAFLRALEAHFGRKRFDEFLAGYFRNHAFQSITTADFRRYLDAELLDGDAALARQLKIDEWLRAPGLPDNAPRPTSAAFAAVDELRRQWLSGTPLPYLRTTGWVTHQWLHFLDNMPASLTAAQVEQLDRRFLLTRSRNSEVLSSWLVLCVRSGYDKADRAVEAFLISVGRRKLIEPIYKALAASGAAGLERARKIYRAARPGYHAITRRTIDALLGWTG